MSAVHRCPGGCGANVRDAMFACYDCWGELPSNAQHSIYSTARLPFTAPRRQAALAVAVTAYLRRARESKGRLIVPPEWAAVVED